MKIENILKDDLGKRILKIKKLAMEMNMKIVSLKVPEVSEYREEYETTYPEKFMGLYICEHESMLTPRGYEKIKLAVDKGLDK